MRKPVAVVGMALWQAVLLAQGVVLVAVLAVAWVLQNENLACAIIGASRPEQVAENVAASGVVIPTEAMAKIDEALGDVVVRDPAMTKANSPKVRPT